MSRARTCPDCPATRSRTLEVLAERPTGCALRCLAVAAREPLPRSWSDEYAIALVRRGVIVRQRLDAHGRASAIDVAGAGSAIPLPSPDDAASMAYAADDAMLCLCPRGVLADAIAGAPSAASDVVRAQTAMLTRVERLADARGRRDASSRVAALLLAIADTLVPATKLDVVPNSIRQRDLAALAALRHESVCRELGRLEDANVVARTGAGLALLDRRALERV